MENTTFNNFNIMKVFGSIRPKTEKVVYQESEEFDWTGKKSGVVEYTLLHKEANSMALETIELSKIPK